MAHPEGLNKVLSKVKEVAYDPCSLQISDLQVSPEGKDYGACRFSLNGLTIICRNAKITPKKNGQFVTCWRRNSHGVTEPFHVTDEIDFYVINVTKENRIGQFVLPKSALIEHSLISTPEKPGKRGFRVYPDWDTPTSQQATKTQQWQSRFFIELDDSSDWNVFERLYQKHDEADE